MRTLLFIATCAVLASTSLSAPTENEKLRHGIAKRGTAENGQFHGIAKRSLATDQEAAIVQYADLISKLLHLAQQEEAMAEVEGLLDSNLEEVAAQVAIQKRKSKKRGRGRKRRRHDDDDDDDDDSSSSSDSDSDKKGAQAQLLNMLGGLLG